MEGQSAGVAAAVGRGGGLLNGFTPLQAER
jgi:hypothetical protein